MGVFSYICNQLVQPFLLWQANKFFDKRSGNADYLDKPSERVERERAAGSQGVPKEQAAICHRSCPVHVHYICGICPVQNRTSSGQVAGR